MRNPRRSQMIGLMFCLSGLIGIGVLCLIPDGKGRNQLLDILLIFYAPNAVLFGGGSAIYSHLKLRAKEKLVRGEEVVARWRVDAATWRGFVAVNARLNQERGALLNEFSTRKEVPADGVEVIAGKGAVQIDESIHLVPLWSTPELTGALLCQSAEGIAYIELRLYYPGGGHGASGVPQAPRRTVLRFPVAVGEERQAEALVERYNNPPRKPDFFHGRGDGSDPEDLSHCYKCGYETYKLQSHCPQCGASMQSRRWSRRFGWILIGCGFFITGIMAVVLYHLLPLLLHPGVEINGSKFNAKPEEALVVMGILGAVTIFGVTCLGYGAWQAKTGRRNRRVVFFMVGICGLLYAVAMWIM